MEAPVARGEQARLRREVFAAPTDWPTPQDRTDVPTPRETGDAPIAREAPSLGLAPPPPLRLENLYLLDPVANETAPIEELVFSDQGIGVIEHRGQPARVLPWSSVSAHVIEARSGGVVPEWWVDPELERNEASSASDQTVTDPDARVRAWPSTEPGSLIGIQTPTGTYRFLVAGADPVVLSGRISAIAVRHRGPSAMAPAETAADERRARGRRAPEQRSTWSKVQPYLVVLLVVFIAASVTLILLQSSGAIHLPFLGGGNSGSLGRLSLRSR